MFDPHPCAPAPPYRPSSSWRCLLHLASTFAHQAKVKAGVISLTSTPPPTHFTVKTRTSRVRAAPAAASWLVVQINQKFQVLGKFFFFFFSLYCALDSVSQQPCSEPSTFQYRCRKKKKYFFWFFLVSFSHPTLPPHPLLRRNCFHAHDNSK